jgi:catechol 2,3-dioxygenase-like lactoylglutathione lyase family enzyme
VGVRWGAALLLTAAAALGAAAEPYAGAELHVLSRVHFNANVSNFERSKAFYEKLGFKTISGFPDTNTLEMAQAIGIRTLTAYDGSQGGAAGGYLLHGELIGLGFTGGVIDLIEFTIPRNDAPPYARLNHLGMTHAEMLTTDIDADYAYMIGIGVEFLSAPVQRRNGARFAMFKDPDGTFYELREIEGDVEATETTHIQRLGAVNINVSDYRRSAAWYGMLGFELTEPLDATESLAVAQAMGFDAPFEIVGGRFTHRRDGSQLKIVQWISPKDDAPPYPLPINHLGIHRMAFATSDIEADVAALRAQGVPMISEITPCCSGPDSWGGIIAFHDPDGTVMELVEQPFMTFMDWIMRWFR